MNIRSLDFDDLLLLELLADGRTLTAAASSLSLTQPATTQRLRKIEDIFKGSVVEKEGRGLRLTDLGKALAQKAKDALSLFEVSEGRFNPSPTINIGSRPEAGRSWLWPCLVKLRKQSEAVTFHLSFGSGSEILKQLGAGDLDVVLTSAPRVDKGYIAIDLVQENYVFVAVPTIAQDIKTADDLKKQTLVEHDRSFPFLAYLDSNQRAQFRFRDVWFAGSTTLMADAILTGLAIGIVPHYIVSGELERGTLQRISLNVDLGFDYFRLIYRNDRPIQNAVHALAAELKEARLL